MENEKLLSFKELQEVLGVTYYVLKNMVDEGLPYLPVGKCRKFRYSKVMEYLEQQKKGKKQ